MKNIIEIGEEYFDIENGVFYEVKKAHCAPRQFIVDEYELDENDNKVYTYKGLILTESELIKRCI